MARQLRIDEFVINTYSLMEVQHRSPADTIIKTLSEIRNKPLCMDKHGVSATAIHKQKV